ncbi:hypothetical protein D3C86_681340 [compost metagenome]
MFGQKAAAIVLAEKAIETPEAFLLGADIQQVHHQQVTGLGAFDTDGAGQEVHRGQVHIAHIRGIVIVLDRAARPVVGFKHEVIARLDPRRHGNIGMPAIVHAFVFVGGLGQVDLDQGFRHVMLL